MGKPFIDRTGLEYGLLTAVTYLGKVGGSKSKWRCLCECGNTVDVTSSNLATGHTQSCGCKRVEFGKSKRLYPKEYSAEYQVWRGIKQRTGDKSGKNSQWYAHVSICDEWVNSFDQFIQDMGPRPSATHSIERLDSTKGYCADNCVWATPKDQANNRNTNRLISYRYQTKTLAQWAETVGIRASTIAARLDRYKWPVDKALTIPVRK